MSKKKEIDAENKDFEYNKWMKFTKDSKLKLNDIVYLSDKSIAHVVSGVTSRIATGIEGTGWPWSDL